MSFVSYQNLEINKLEICENSFIQKSDFFKKSDFYTDQHFHKFDFSSVYSELSSFEFSSYVFPLQKSENLTVWSITTRDYPYDTLIDVGKTFG